MAAFWRSTSDGRASDAAWRRDAAARTRRWQQLQTTNASDLFPGARAPEAGLSGLYLYFSCFDQSHEISQSIDTVEGSFWHGILHRQEPDANNARYWFRRVPSHPIFPGLAATRRRSAARVSRSRGFDGAVDGRPLGSDPVRRTCATRRADEPGSPLEKMALEIQRAEWQLLFDYCARSDSNSKGSRGL